MATLTSYAAKAIGDAMLGKAAFPTIGPMYMGFSLASPGPSGSLVTEVSGGSYARRNVSPSMDAFDAATGATTNNAAIVFPAPTAAWGTIVYAFWADALTGGNVWAYQQLSPPMTVNSSDPAPGFDVGTITFAFTGITGYAAKKIGDAMLSKAAFPTITTMYQALLTANPGIGGSLASEPTGGSYARQPITASMQSFDPVLGSSTDAIAITFPVPTDAWGTISYTAWVDAPTGGNMWAYAQLPAARAIVSGSFPPSFLPGFETFVWS